jgi:hypothetical protein
MKNLVVSGNPNAPQRDAMQQRPEFANNKETSWNRASKQRLRPIKGDPGMTIILRCQIIQQLRSMRPQSLQGRTTPEPMQHSFFLLLVTHGTKLVNLGGNAPSPRINGHGLVPHLPD